VFGVYSHGKVLSPVAATLGAWIILSSLIDPIDRLRRKLSLPRSVIGMSVAHIGLGIFVLSITTVESFTLERDVALGQGERAVVGNYEFRFNGVKPIEGPNYNGVEGTVVVTRHGVPTSVVYPQKRQYWVQRQVTTEAAIEMHHGSNVFVALGDELGAGKWSVRFQIRPLVNFLWLGAFIMAVGGAIAATDRRYRAAQQAVTAPVATPGIAGEGAG
jgi:cytochrome c-type biogenesis protein CcmF